MVPSRGKKIPNFTSEPPSGVTDERNQHLSRRSVILPASQPPAGQAEAEREHPARRRARAQPGGGPRGERPIPAGLRGGARLWTRGGEGGRAWARWTRRKPVGANSVDPPSALPVPREAASILRPPKPSGTPGWRPQRSRGLERRSVVPRSRSRPAAGPPRAALTYLCTSVRTRLQSMAPPAAPARAQRPGARLSAPMGPGPRVAARPRPGHGLDAPGGAGGGRGPSAFMPRPARGGRRGGGCSAALASRPGCWRWGCGLEPGGPGGSCRCSAPPLCSSPDLASARLPSPPGSPARRPSQPCLRPPARALTSRARVSMRPRPRPPPGPRTRTLARRSTRALGPPSLPPGAGRGPGSPGE